MSDELTHDQKKVIVRKCSMAFVDAFVALTEEGHPNHLIALGMIVGLCSTLEPLGVDREMMLESVNNCYDSFEARNAVAQALDDRPDGDRETDPLPDPRPA